MWHMKIFCIQFKRFGLNDQKKKLILSSKSRLGFSEIKKYKNPQFLNGCFNCKSHHKSKWDNLMFGHSTKGY